MQPWGHSDLRVSGGKSPELVLEDMGTSHHRQMPFGLVCGITVRVTPGNKKSKLPDSVSWVISHLFCSNCGQINHFFSSATFHESRANRWRGSDARKQCVMGKFCSSTQLSWLRTRHGNTLLVNPCSPATQAETLQVVSACPPRTQALLCASWGPWLPGTTRTPVGYAVTCLRRWDHSSHRTRPCKPGVLALHCPDARSNMESRFTVFKDLEPIRYTKQQQARGGFNVQNLTGYSVVQKLTN